MIYNGARVYKILSFDKVSRKKGRWKANYKKEMENDEHLMPTSKSFLAFPI